jgi:glutamine amidotransferase
LNRPPVNLAILDYGMGNLRSVEKAAQKVGINTERTIEPEAIRAADGLVLPGVGAFPRAMDRIRETGLDRLIHEAAGNGTPILGICLGYQLIFEASNELGGGEGLGLLAGTVDQVPSQGRKVPHIGWAAVRWEKPSPLTLGMRPGEPFYFVHSYVPEPEPGEVVGLAEYGGSFACVASRGNTFGVQFHPEKSSHAGLRLVENFAGICAGHRDGAGS